MGKAGIIVVALVLAASFVVCLAAFGFTAHRIGYGEGYNDSWQICRTKLVDPMQERKEILQSTIDDLNMALNRQGDDK